MNWLKPFTVSVKIVKPHDWYQSGGAWYEYSTWCTNQLGAGNWEFFNSEFYFKTEMDALLFRLRWTK